LLLPPFGIFGGKRVWQYDKERMIWTIYQPGYIAPVILEDNSILMMGNTHFSS
jgi:hypothetical protein